MKSQFYNNAKLKAFLIEHTEVDRYHSKRDFLINKTICLLLRLSHIWFFDAIMTGEICENAKDCRPNQKAKSLSISQAMPVVLVYLVLFAKLPTAASPQQWVSTTTVGFWKQSST